MATGPQRSNGASGVADEAADKRSATLSGLAQRYAPALSRFFERRVRHQSDVPDLVQDVFLRLSRLRDLSAVEKPENYIFTTAANALRDRARRDAVRERDGHDEFCEEDHGSSVLTPERVLKGKRAVAHLQAVVRSLPERTRDVFVLRVFEDLRMADVAAALRISQRAAEKHYVKGLATVVAALAGHRDD